MLPARFKLYHANNFLENFLAFRLLVLRGRLGSGKTLLGVALAKWLYDHKLVDGIFTNIPIDTGYLPITHQVRRSVVLLDEAWAFADPRLSANQFKGYGAYARKLDSFWISPSKHGVDKRVADLTCRRIADIVALDWWLYAYEDGDESKYRESGWFILSNYRDLYDTFWHKAIPADDGGILESLEAEVAEASGSTHMVYKVERSTWKK